MAYLKTALTDYVINCETAKRFLDDFKIVAELEKKLEDVGKALGLTIVVNEFRQEVMNHMPSVMTARAFLQQLAADDTGQLVNSFEIPITASFDPTNLTVTERLTYQILPTEYKIPVCRDVWSATYVFDTDMSRTSVPGLN